MSEIEHVYDPSAQAQPLWLAEYLTADLRWERMDHSFNEQQMREVAQAVGERFHVRTRIRVATPGLNVAREEDVQAFLATRKLATQFQGIMPVSLTQNIANVVEQTMEQDFVSSLNLQPVTVMTDAEEDELFSEPEDTVPSPGEVAEFAREVEVVESVSYYAGSVTQQAESEASGDEDDYWKSAERLEPETAGREYYITVTLSTAEPTQNDRMAMAALMQNTSDDEVAVFTLTRGVSLPEVTVQSLEHEFGSIIQ